MKRDSIVWWFGMGGAVLTLLSNQFGLLHVSPDWRDRIQLAAALVGIVSGYLRLSPLPLTPGGNLDNQPADPDKALSLTGKKEGVL